MLITTRSEASNGIILFPCLCMFVYADVILKNEYVTSRTKFPPLATHCVNYLYRVTRLK